MGRIQLIFSSSSSPILNFNSWSYASIKETESINLWILTNETTYILYGSIILALDLWIYNPYPIIGNAVTNAYYEKQFWRPIYKSYSYKISFYDCKVSNDLSPSSPSNLFSFKHTRNSSLALVKSSTVKPANFKAF